MKDMIFEVISHGDIADFGKCYTTKMVNSSEMTESKH
jgi:hypothetical protein